MGAVSFGGAAVATMIWAFADHLSTLSIILLCGIWGAMAFPLNAVSVAHANDYAKPDEFVMLSSGLLLMYGIGAVAGPIIASATMGMAGASGLYVFTAIIHATLLVYILNRTIRRRPSPDDDHVPFNDALAASRTTSQVYEEGVENENN